MNACALVRPPADVSRCVQLVHVGNGVGLTGTLYSASSFQNIYLVYLQAELDRYGRTLAHARARARR